MKIIKSILLIVLFLCTMSWWPIIIFGFLAMQFGDWLTSN